MPTTIGTESTQDLVNDLCRDAVEQNRRAKQTSGWARRAAYDRKCELLSLLLLMDHAEINSVEFWAGCPTVGLTLPSGDKLHAVITRLTPDAREVAFRRIEKFWKLAS